MADPSFFGYQQIGEKGFIRWCLDYGFEPIARCFLAIPDDQLYRPLGSLSPAIWYFGHIALNEEGLMKGFARGIWERTCPYSARLFDGGAIPAEAELRAAGIDPPALVAYWRRVREETLAFLDGLTEEELARPAAMSTLAAGDPNRDNPIREFFVMAIQHQYLHWGHLDAIARMAR